MKKEFLINSLCFENKNFSTILFYTFLLMIVLLSINMNKLLIPILFIMIIEGFISFIGFILSYKKMKAFLKNSIETEGEIIEIINDKKTSFKSAYRPLVRFKIKNDKEITFINEVSDKTITGVPFNQDEKVSILYNTKK